MLSMRVYILTDIEGAAGVASFTNDTYEDGRFYLKARSLLTQEVNAAVDGALEAGATEVVVWDGHGPGAVNPEELHEEAKLLHGRGSPPKLLLDRGFDAMMFVGQHSMNNVPDGNLAHTYSSRDIDEMRLNAVPIGEFGLRTYLAGFYGIPVVMLTGDEAACREARALVPNIVTVAVKEGITREIALSVSPAKARALIRAGAVEALKRRAQIAPVPPPPPPYRLEIRYLRAESADRHAKSGARRVDLTTVAIESDNFVDIYR